MTEWAASGGLFVRVKSRTPEETDCVGLREGSVPERSDRLI